MKTIIFITVAFFVFTDKGVIAQEKKHDSTEVKHIVYGALGSPSLFSSINYEIKIKEISNFSIQPRVGIGFNFFKPSLGNEFNVNTGCSFLYGKNKHKAELSLGLVNDFFHNYNYELEKDKLKYKAIIYAALGYRLQPINKGVMFKFLITPTFTFNSGGIVFYPLAEIGVGYVFGNKQIL